MFVCNILGGILSILLAYAWYGVATASPFNADNAGRSEQHLRYWISFLFTVFHQGSVDANMDGKNVHMYSAFAQYYQSIINIYA